MERGDTNAWLWVLGLIQGCAVLPMESGLSWKEISMFLDVPGALASPYCFPYPLLPQLQGNSKKYLSSSNSPAIFHPGKVWQVHLILSKMSKGHIGLVPGQFSPYIFAHVPSSQKGARCLLHGWRRGLFKTVDSTRNQGILQRNVAYTKVINPKGTREVPKWHSHISI